MKNFLILIVSLFALAAHAEIIEFTIPAGTGNQPWNTTDTVIMAKVGDTIRFMNADSINHTLHTNGSPCSHGNLMRPGQTWDCNTRSTYNSMDERMGPLYDHSFGPSAAVWIIVD